MIGARKDDEGCVAPTALDMDRLRGSRDPPGSELADLGATVASADMTDDSGSTNSLSGLGIPSGAKSDSRREDAMRTVAAAREYDGRDNLSGRSRVRRVACSSNRKSRILPGNPVVADLILGIEEPVLRANEDDGIELALVDIVFAEPALPTELAVLCEEPLVTVSARRCTTDVGTYLFPGDECTEPGSSDDSAGRGGLGIRFGSNRPWAYDFAKVFQLRGSAVCTAGGGAAIGSGAGRDEITPALPRRLDPL